MSEYNERMSRVPEPNELTGARVRELRTRRDMHQAVLALAMRRSGFRWHQQTVARVEAGSRPVRLNEATALAEIFGVPLETFSEKAAS